MKRSPLPLRRRSEAFSMRSSPNDRDNIWHPRYTWGRDPAQVDYPCKGMNLLNSVRSKLYQLRHSRLRSATFQAVSSPIVITAIREQVRGRSPHPSRYECLPPCILATPITCHTQIESQSSLPATSHQACEITVCLHFPLRVRIKMEMLGWERSCINFGTDLAPIGTRKATLDV